MTFSQAVRSVVVENYFNLKGRAPRSEFWWFFLAYILGAFVVALIGFGILSIVYALALFLPFMGVGFRRMQDTGRPGWYYLIPTLYNLGAQLLMPTMNIEVDPETGMPLEMPAMGAVAFSGILGLVGIIIAIVFLWWLTRPSQPETNEYGPPPAEART